MMRLAPAARLHQDRAHPPHAYMFGTRLQSDSTGESHQSARRRRTTGSFVVWPAALAAALTAAIVLLSAPTLVAWLQGLYPLTGGRTTRAAAFLSAALCTWVLSIVTLAVWFAPSWVVARVVAPADALSVRALRCFVIAFVLQPLAHGTMLLAVGVDLPPPAYRLATLTTQLLLIVMAGAWMLRARTGARETGIRLPRDTIRWAVLGAAILIVTVLLLPRLAWQDLNPDGGELLTMGRSLGSHIVARLPTGEIPGVNLGMVTIAYPVDWLIATTGLSEPAARLPTIAYLAGMVLGVAAIAEHRAARALRTREFAVLALGVVAVGLTLAFNASYDPYSTDLASPTSIDLLTMVFLLATLHFLFAGEVAWCLASAVLMSLSRPSALLLCLLTSAALLLIHRDWRVRPFQTAVLATLATLVVSVLYASVFSSMIGDPVAEGGGNLLTRIRFLRFDDWRRLAWLAVPGGVLPVLSFLHWRRMETRGRVLALVTLGYFAFFYCLAFVSLHHFAPAMLLPLAVLWRSEVERAVPSSPAWLVAVLAGVVFAGYAATPRDSSTYRDARRLGSTLVYEIGDYGGDYRARREAFESRDILDSLFTPYALVRDAQRDRVGSPWTFIHYAWLAETDADRAQYIVRAADRERPAGTTRIAMAHGAALYVRDAAAWRAERRTPPPPDPRSRWYDLPRTTLFAHLGRTEGVPQVDLRALADRLLGR